MSTQPESRIPTWTQGDRLRKARENAGLSQHELADMIGVSRATVSNAEVGVGKKGPLAITVRAWALATGVPVEWIETGRAASDPGSGGQSPSGRRLSDTELMQYRSRLVVTPAVKRAA